MAESEYIEFESMVCYAFLTRFPLFDFFFQVIFDLINTGMCVFLVTLLIVWFVQGMLIHYGSLQTCLQWSSLARFHKQLKIAFTFVIYL